MNTHFIIAGVSSHLGTSICRQLVHQSYNVTGSYKTWNENLDDLEKIFRDKGLSLDLNQVDLLNRQSLNAFGEKIINSALDNVKNVCFIYCCGSWYCGPLTKTKETDIDYVINVGLIAPFLLTSYLLRINKPIKVILITGLGGIKNAVMGNSLYGAVTSGIYTLVRSVGMELAGTNSCCTGLALGLFDKGQPYMPALCKNLNIKELVKVEEIVDFILELCVRDNRALNGSIIEMGGEIFDYSNIIKFLLSKQ